MQIVEDVRTIRNWGLEALPGESEVFSVTGNVTKEEVSALERDINRQRGVDRVTVVWEGAGTGCSRDQATTIYISCTS
jgi:hypothetical protein